MLMMTILLAILALLIVAGGTSYIRKLGKDKEITRFSWSLVEKKER